MLLAQIPTQKSTDVSLKAQRPPPPPSPASSLSSGSNSTACAHVRSRRKVSGRPAPCIYQPTMVSHGLHLASLLEDVELTLIDLTTSSSNVVQDFVHPQHLETHTHMFGITQLMVEQRPGWVILSYQHGPKMEASKEEGSLP